jgi:probable HAF family extracellular repeat protein
MRRLYAMFVAVVSLTPSASAAAQEACARTAIDALGQTNGYVRGLNNSGVVVGELVSPDVGPLPFIWRSGETRVLALNEATAGGANSINEAGRVVGWVLADGKEVPVTWMHGRVQRLQFDGEGEAAAIGINNRGQIVGYEFSGPCLLWEKEDRAPLQFGGGDGNFCSPSAINDDGLVVGAATTRGDSYAFAWDSGTFTRIAAPLLPSGEGLSNPRLQDVNNQGVAVGTASGETRVYGFVWTRASGSTLLPYPQYPNAVNDRGLIAITSQGPDDPEATLILADRSGGTRTLGGLGVGRAEFLRINARMQLAFSALELGVGYHPHICQLR